jgi:ribosomal protein S9
METPDHLEHIEHAQHASHAGGFDRRVAVTMAIVAAMLAAVTMLSHRAHNDTLRLQTEANILHTRATDEWGYYQAKNIRRQVYQADIDLIGVLAKDPGAEAQRDSVRSAWSKHIAKYDQELAEQKLKAEQLVKDAEQKMEESQHAHHHADRFDFAELGVELGLVLCSLAVLTKRLPFWYSGMVSALIGVAIAATAFFVH